MVPQNTWKMGLCHSIMVVKLLFQSKAMSIFFFRENWCSSRVSIKSTVRVIVADALTDMGAGSLMELLYADNLEMNPGLSR